ncbi:hypothetical protein [Runella slithyformis]|uniref:Prenyltransferase n=1 Tax=Runella slithyformis (strain ATCC 29530 / DSM 19594 / LMG 11500 / NCIMB 11436 / LSU 4) TaxID=761193 RepID=A0A7U3ZG40_RUNSL|nr:hypothetical protein [Runella slithyformis]AEI46591.1 hypothetical protein Runsl_0133 [Runella slithyformis DSM 19594]
MKWLQNMIFIINYYLQRAHWLSLDVVVGAMVTHVIASRLPDGHGKVSWVSTALAGIAVFMIYVVDRLLDNRKPDHSPTPRHAFHVKHEGLLIKVLSGLGAVACVLLFWVPAKVLWFGLGLTGLVALYLWFAFKISVTHIAQVFKEPLVALVYTAGIWGPAILTQTTLAWESSVLMALYGLLAFQNLLLFSWFESLELEEGFSLAIAWGTETVSAALNWLLWLIVAGALCVLFFTSYRYCVRAAIVVTVMSACTHWLKRSSATALPDERYRRLGDGIFLITLWLL